MGIWKTVQKHVVTHAGSKAGVALIIVSLFALLFNSLNFFYSSVISTPHDSIYYESTMHVFQDNIGGKYEALSLAYGPIDIVYTWVNGSDQIWSAEKDTWSRYNNDFHSTPSSSSTHNTNKHMNISNNSNSMNNITTGDADDRVSPNRYRDSDELRYSLRSIYKYAPWVRKIYVVTANQIPWWMDLENDRIQVVSHNEIFPNTSHLPVFSSPSIESHIHLIPGLSKHFIYFNDDVFLGAPTKPEDFISIEGQQKLIMAWDVPKCAPGCVDSWIGDGYCDKACNVSSCNFDYPDCINGTNSKTQQKRTNLVHCSKGCPDSWLGDRSCDMRCQNAECAFDAGDCGIDLLFQNFPGAVVAVNNFYKANNQSDEQSRSVRCSSSSNSGEGMSAGCNYSQDKTRGSYKQKNNNNVDEQLREEKGEKEIDASGDQFNEEESELVLVVMAGTKAVHFNLSELASEGGIGALHNGTARFKFTEAIHSDSSTVHSSFLLKMHSLLVVIFFSGQNDAPEPPALPHNIFFKVSGYDIVSGHNATAFFRMRIIPSVAPVLPVPVGMSTVKGYIGSCKRGGVEVREPHPLLVDMSLLDVPFGGPNAILDAVKRSMWPQGVVILASLGKSASSSPNLIEITKKTINSFSLRHSVSWRRSESGEEESAVQIVSLCSSLALYSERNGISWRYGLGLCDSYDLTLKDVFDHKWLIVHSNSSANSKELQTTAVGRRIGVLQSAQIALLAPSPIAWPSGNSTWLRSRIELLQKVEDKPDNGDIGIGGVVHSCLTTAFRWGGERPVPVLPSDNGYNNNATDNANATATDLTSNSSGNATSVALSSFSASSSIDDTAGDLAPSSVSEQRRLAIPAIVIDSSSNSNSFYEDMLFNSRSVSGSSSIGFGSKSTKSMNDRHKSRSRRRNLIEATVNTMFDRQLARLTSTSDGSYTTRISNRMSTNPNSNRRLLDTYSDSLIHVNRLYTKAFGTEARKVPAHVPHMINVEFMNEMQRRWEGEWIKTSENRFRSSSDMQYAFAYYHYVMNRANAVPDFNDGQMRAGIGSYDHLLQNPSTADNASIVTNAMIDNFISTEIDTDHDGYIDDNEFHTLACLVSETPPCTKGGNFIRNNCSAFSLNNTIAVGSSARPPPRGYVLDSEAHFRILPSNEDVAVCKPAQDGIIKHLKKQYVPFLIVKSDAKGDIVAFEMIGDNITESINQLDSIRCRKSKFICINDNMQNPSTVLVEALKSFFQAMYPRPSPFELPQGQRNPTLYLNEYRSLKKQGSIQNPIETSNILNNLKAIPSKMLSFIKSAASPITVAGNIESTLKGGTSSRTRSRPTTLEESENNLEEILAAIFVLLLLLFIVVLALFRQIQIQKQRND